MSTLIRIVAPTLLGLSEVSPKKDAPAWALIFAGIGVASGATGIYLAMKGEIEKALLADANSIIFDLMSILKAWEAI